MSQQQRRSRASSMNFCRSSSSELQRGPAERTTKEQQEAGRSSSHSREGGRLKLTIGGLPTES